jgi:hypothetical protein
MPPGKGWVVLSGHSLGLRLTADGGRQGQDRKGVLQEVADAGYAGFGGGTGMFANPGVGDPRLRNPGCCERWRGLELSPSSRLNARSHHSRDLTYEVRDSATMR